MVGPQAVERLKGSRVIVFGVGGVGGYVVEVLARSGVGEIAIVDADTVSVTNLNRQILALHSTVGERKVDVCAKRIKDINPDCRVAVHDMFYLPENADEIDLSRYDYVVDCIDTVKAKIELIRRCKELQVPIICSMGTANKVSPFGLKLTDLSKTNIDPLARVMRKKLRKIGIEHVEVLYSEEEPRRYGASDEALDSNSHPIPASNAYVPAIAGLMIGGEVARRLMGDDDQQ